MGRKAFVVRGRYGSGKGTNARPKLDLSDFVLENGELFGGNTAK